ncbi:hypothetical protein FA95DRAFT_1554057 [Auriscalpium vulgare]|uniref:Uncharacterized protein n=1 Tax=Auriscalpium vulgare TaxID=40419 RepID=A0ACB8S6T3_9AGAM|nr:hypothetical protein FA95DRAFT_1554057 [Auriscalpium vulgare]
MLAWSPRGGLTWASCCATAGWRAVGTYGPGATPRTLCCTLPLRCGCGGCDGGGGCCAFTVSTRCSWSRVAVSRSRRTVSWRVPSSLPGGTSRFR